MRALVRTLGSLLIVFGAVLWIAKGALAPSPPPPTPVTVAPPSPSKHSSSHGGAHGSAGDVATKGSTAAKVLSSVQMGQASPTLHDFVIHLYKQDGWFDTGIPITADLWLNMRTLDANPGPISDAHWVRGLVGSAIIYPPNDIQGGQEVVTMAASDDHNENAKGSLPVYLPLPQNALHTLKLKIFPDSGPNDVRFRLKIQALPLNRDRPTEFSAAQQREMTELHKWELK